MWGSRCNRISNSFHSNVISTSGFHLRFRGRHFGFPMSVDVGHCRQCHIRIGRSRKCGVAVGIASLTLAVRVLFPLPVFTSGFVADILGFRCWTMSGCVDSAISRSGTVENVGVAVGIFSPPPSIQKLFPLPAFTSGFHFRYRGRRFVFPMLADVGPCRQCHF